MFVPSPRDTIAIAVAHGALGAHESSDWLTDMVASIDGVVDWGVLETLIDRHDLHIPAASALRYIQERLLRSIPPALLHRLESEAYRRPMSTLAALSETRPKGVDLYRLARAVSKQGRLLRSRRRECLRRPIVYPSVFSGWQKIELTKSSRIIAQVTRSPAAQAVEG